MEVGLNISENTDSKTVSILKRYWIKTGLKYTETIPDILRDLDMSAKELNELVKRYSTFIFELACYRCGGSIRRTALTRGKISTIAWFPCKDCVNKDEEEIRSHLRMLKDKENLPFLESTGERRWERLKFAELKIFGLMLQCRDLNEIKQKIFHGKFNDQIIWHSVNILQTMSLIVVVRNQNRNVLDIRFDRTIDPGSIAEYINARLSQSPKQVTYEALQEGAEYSGTFVLTEDIKLAAGIRYSFKGLCQRNTPIELIVVPVEESEHPSRWRRTATAGEICKNIIYGSPVSTNDDQIENEGHVPL